MSSEKKSGKDKKKSEKKTSVDDLEPNEDDDVKGGASLSLADATTEVSADLERVARKITPADTDSLNYKITPETKPTTR